MWYAKKYDPLQAGSIDGTDSVPHDHGIIRAQLSNYLPPRDNNDITSDPYKTLFVGRLNPITTEGTLRHLFEKFGSIKKVKLVCNLVTGDPRGYAFIEFDHEKACEDAYKNSYKLTIDDRMVLVDYERSRVMKGWIPRRLGGGFGGRKESGQLRFGAIDRPFKRPLHVVGNQNMPEILPDQKHEDCWRRQDKQRSKNDHYRNDRKKPDDRHSYSHDRNDVGDGNSSKICKDEED
nr:12969_t:CDS:2 [Entrophospora candida]